MFSDQHLSRVKDFMDTNGIHPFPIASPEEFDGLVKLVRIVADVEELKKPKEAARKVEVEQTT